MKKILSCILFMLLIFTFANKVDAAAICIDCGNGDHSGCTSAVLNYGQKNSTYHNVYCCCGVKPAVSLGTQKHDFSTSTTCSKCGYKSTASCIGCASSSTHASCINKTYKNYDETRHIIYCCCGSPIITSGSASMYENHSYSWSTSEHRKFCVCGKSVYHTSYAKFKWYDENYEKCTYDSGRCKVKRKHVFSEWKYNETQHWKLCTTDSQDCSSHKFNLANHSFTEPCMESGCNKKICSVCGFHNGDCNKLIEAESNAPNIPIVVQGMTRIKLINGSWVEIVDTEEHPWYEDNEWYDYNNGSWANIKLNDGTEYVWIPRFTYKIEDESISIKWSDGIEDDTQNGYLKHPAFFFGEYLGGDTFNNGNFIERNGTRNELTGFWLQKNLFSESTTDVSESFFDAIDMKKDTKYGLPQAGVYTHMTKGSEWGALAYLAVAKGKVTGNKTTVNDTGVNVGAVTEYVASIKGEPDIATEMLDSEYGKYRDVINKELTEYLGYALTETILIAENVGDVSEEKFLIRGGDLGLFGYSSASGTDGNGYRTSIAILPGELTDTIAFFDTEASVIEGDYLVIGVDFYVSENNWKFPDISDNFFTELESLDGKKIIDIECLYEGNTTWHQPDLNASVIRLINNDFGLVAPESIASNTPYPSGKYTLMVRVGGKDADDMPIFKSILGTNAKIIVNEINLKDSNGNIMRIGNIPNNKVRLTIYGQGGTSVITKVALVKTSDNVKTDYAKYESLNLNGWSLIPYLGGLEGEPIPLNIGNVVNPNITDESGENILVALKYGEHEVIQEGENQFIINVSDEELLVIKGNVKLGSVSVGSQLRKGPGEYSRTNSNVTEPLVAYDFLKGYMFSSWSSDSTIVKANSNSYSTTITIPSISTNLTQNPITITANYVSPDRLEVSGQRTEFLVGEDFELGGTAVLKSIYIQDINEFEKEFQLSTSGVEIGISNGGNQYPLENLQAGTYLVTISYAGKSVSYNIEVVNRKYELTIYNSFTDCGDVSGIIAAPSGVSKAEFSLAGEEKQYRGEISYGNTITLTATPKSGYYFAGWKVTGKDDLVTDQDLKNLQLSFAMPAQDIRIDAEFLKLHVLTFKIKAGQETIGTLTGDLEQEILPDQDATAVTASVNQDKIDRYAFSRWVDSESKLVSNNAELICRRVNKTEEYTAVFDNIWWVTFYDGVTKLGTTQVVNGGSTSFEAPAKYGYIFTGWDKSLNNVTSDLNVYANYVPRISITETGVIGVVEIKSTMIQEGTLQYIVSPSQTEPEFIYFDYTQDGGNQGWTNSGELYRSKQVAASHDASSLLIFESNNPTETIKFDYTLSAASDAQLGITINGEKVVGPSTTIQSVWNSFEKEVNVIGGQIRIGLTYSRGANGEDSDYAAIKNLAFVREWTTIPSPYVLEIPGEFTNNYVHVRGVGSDDGITYTAVSTPITIGE